MRTTLNHTMSTMNKRAGRTVRAAAVLAAAALLLGPAARSGADAPADPAVPVIPAVAPAAAAADPVLELPPLDPVTPAPDDVVAAVDPAPAGDPPLLAVDPAAPAVAAPPTTAPSTQPATQPSTQPATVIAPTAPVVPAVAAAPATQPAPLGMFENVAPDGRVHLLVGRAVMLKSRVPYTQAAFSQPDVAKDNPLPDGILVTALKAGSTQLIVWDRDNKTQSIDVVVDVDLNALTEMVTKSFPQAKVQLSSANGTLVARGTVPSLQQAEQIVELLGAYGKVINFLEMSGGQQVMMQVRFAEVSRSATTNLGVNFGFADGTSHFAQNAPGGGPFGVVDGNGGLTRGVAGSVTLFGGGQIGSTAFNVFVSALRNNNLLRVLAEPNISTISGKEAKFLAGGEFPIPVPQSGGAGNAAITVEFKRFGIQLTFVPIVLGDGRIRLNGTAEVSDLDFSRSVTMGGFVIPSLTTRTVTTTVELQEGQTFSVAGLLNSRVTANKSAIPLLGDIPVLGSLFRSVRYERNETELVVLVTPRLVEGMNPKQVPELPGERWLFPSESDLFLNQYLGGPSAKGPSAAKPGPARYRGSYGFVPAETKPKPASALPDVATTTDGSN